MAPSSTDPHPKVTIFRGWDTPKEYVWSPFVIKLEARLRFAGVSYRSEGGSPMKAPRRKIPYAALSRSGSGDEAGAATEILADSSLIIERLVKEGVLEDVNAKLSPVDRAHDAGLQALIEEKLYFYQTYEMWHDNYYTMISYILATVPYPVRVPIGLWLHRTWSQIHYGQGTGHFTAGERTASKREIWGDIDALLSESRNKYDARDEDDAVFWVLGGNQPSEADATLFGFISALLITTALPETQEIVRSFPVVVDYVRRIHERYFPDFVMWK